MSGCDAVLLWGESRLIHTHRALRSGRIEQRKCRLRVASRPPNWVSSVRSPGPNFGPKHADTRRNQSGHGGTIAPLKAIDIDYALIRGRYRNGCPAPNFKTGAIHRLATRPKLDIGLARNLIGGYRRSSEPMRVAGTQIATGKESSTSMTSKSSDYGRVFFRP